jgi:hypothetical protein
VVVSPTSLSQDRHINNKGGYSTSTSVPPTGKVSAGSSNRSTTSSTLYGAQIDSVASSFSETSSLSNTTGSRNINTSTTNNPPPTSLSTRRLLEGTTNSIDEDTFHKNNYDRLVHCDEKVDRMKSPIVPLNHPSDDGLSASTLSPGRNDDDLDMLFLPESTSSSDILEDDERNENDCTFGASRIPTGPRTPEQQHQQENGGTVIDHRVPMKTPGLAIPTPAYTKGSVRLDAAGEYHHTNSTNSNSSSNLRDVNGVLPFSSYPLRSITESPIRRDDRLLSNNNNIDDDDNNKHQVHNNQRDDAVESQQQSIDDLGSLPDDAFLPDDFNIQHTSTRGGADDDVVVAMVPMDEMESRIQMEKVRIRQELNEQWEEKIRSFQDEAEAILVEHGRAWKQEADAESDRLKTLLKEEKSKTAKKHHELLNHSQRIAEMMEKLQQSEVDREALQKRIASLEKNSPGSREMDAPNQADDTMSLQDVNVELNRQILAMQKEVDELREKQIVSSNREELVILKGEKAAAERQIQDLTERLKVRTSSCNDALVRLEEAENEITNLRGQQLTMEQSKLNSSFLTSMSDTSLEELFATKAEIEKMKCLRDEDKQVNEDLKAQLVHVEEMLRNEVQSPGRSRSVAITSSSSLPVDELQTAKDLQRAKEQLQAMGTVLKRYKTERDNIKHQMTALQQQQVQAIEIAVKHATKDVKEKVHSLTEENDRIRQESVQMTTTEIDQLTAQVEEMKKRHDDEVVQLTEESASRIQQAQIESEKQLEEIKHGLTKLHEEEMAASQRIIEELRLQHEDEIEIVKSKAKEEAEIEVSHLQDTIRQIKVEFENEKIELIQTTSKDIEELEEQMKAMNQRNDEEVQRIRSEANGENQSLREQVGIFQKELDAKVAGSYTEEFVTEMKSKFEDDLMDVKSKAKNEVDNLRLTLESTIAERSEAVSNATKLQAQLTEIQGRLAAQSKQDKSDSERLLRELQQEHAKESDELLEQLDLVEAEHNERYHKLQLVVKEKDTVISAMGSQLADSESKYAGTSKKLNLLSQEVEALKILLQEATADVEASRQEIMKLSEDHLLAMKNEAVLREKACEEAREEMIQRAEKQFEERQEMYKTLKNQFNNSTSKISVLERDLRFAKKETEELKKRQEGREADLRDELAQSKAALASSQANMIRTEKSYLVALESAKTSEDQTKAKLEESQVVCDSVQRTLASLVAEKERLAAELIDMKQVCEELMAMVEGQSAG